MTEGARGGRGICIFAVFSHVPVQWPSGTCAWYNLNNESLRCLSTTEPR